MKRFWDAAAIAESGGRFTVSLDARPVRLPGGTPLTVASRPLAEAIAAEWNAAAGGRKESPFTPEEVPLTRLVGTAAERIAPDPAATVGALAKYGETDLLCYRADDRRLAERQAAEWDPLLDWATLTLDAPLRVTAGVMPVAQDPQALSALRRAIESYPALEIAALGVAVPALGSLVLGLALAAGRLDAEAAHRLATLDERFQEEFWGLDAEAEQRRTRLAAEVSLAARLIALARG
ncbi:chaperone, ATP12 [Falsiroseomonas bella]|uniref:Chaperone, ATP12 n=1 Tax=Falsiroseomonas bella TaxID=2184016 RepID=A0A317FGJ6_9PROT|nr:ATP12 family protein [Falsiroseomonas bella]PWS36758.1 chaperone, ATP12 [Falsiroseomonas bella]